MQQQNPSTPKRITQTEVFESAPTFLALPKGFVQKLVGATPDMTNLTNLLSHDAPTTITSFLKGQPGQTLVILGNGNTTISHNAVIKTNTGANKVLLADIVYRFTYFWNEATLSGIWYEDE